MRTHHLHVVLGSALVLFAPALACSSNDGTTTADGANAAPGAGNGTGGGGATSSGSSDGTGGGTTTADGGDGSTTGGPAPAPGCPAGIASDPKIAQALPTATVSTALPPVGKITTLNAGADLQAAIDAAQPGDTLELEAGATFTGPITLPNKSGAGWIVIRTSTPDASFVTPGTRVSPALASKMAKIVAPAGPNAIAVAKGAHHYRFIGVEVTAQPGAYVNSLVDLSVDTTSASDLAHDIILDRVYLHADPVGGRRGVALNSASSAVVDSYLAGFREHGADSQAIAGWLGPGPYRIVDNYLEAASENVMFGGSDPRIPNLVPSDIQICGNHLKKDIAWKGGGWVVKNLFELKNAQRVLAAGNVMEYNWADGQSGFAVLFTPRNQDGSAPWSGVQDATFALNVVRHTGSGVNLLAGDDNQPSIPLRRIVVRDNLVDDVDPTTYGGDGRAWQFVYGEGHASDVLVDHNTTTSDRNAALVLGDTAKYGSGFVFTNNVVPHGDYGVFGGGQGEGSKALDYYLLSYTLTKNVFFGSGTPSAAYPAGNAFPASTAAVGFANASGGDWSLAATSPYHAAGTDGRDIGADLTALTAATKNVAP